MYKPRFKKIVFSFLVATFLFVIIVSPNIAQAQAGGVVQLGPTDSYNLYKTNANTQVTAVQAQQIAAQQKLDAEKKEAEKRAQQVRDSISYNLIANALIPSVSMFFNRLAYNFASDLAQGGKGGKPLIYTQSWKDYLSDAGGAAAGEFLNDLRHQPWNKIGFNFCNPSFNVKLVIQLAFIQEAKPEPKCPWSQIASNYGRLADQFSNNPKTLLSLAGLQFQRGQSELDIASSANNALYQKVWKNDREAEAARQEGNGFKPVLGGIADNVRTPASVFQNELNQQSVNAHKASEIHVSSFLTNSSLYAAFGATAGAVFVNTLAEKLLQRFLDGFIPDTPTPAPNIPDPRLLSNGESQATLASPTQVYADLLTVQLSPITQYNPVNDFISCDLNLGIRGTNHCVMDQSFALAVNSASAGSPVTVEQAIANGWLHGDWSFISAHDVSDNSNPNCYTHAYCESNLKKMRLARVIPVGWEIAASQSAFPHRITLREAVNNFANCNASGSLDSDHPWCHLIDPNWVIKLPLTQCLSRMPGATRVSANGPERESICVDAQTCIEENEKGECVGGYGYCEREKQVWRLHGDQCPAQFASCLTLQTRDSKTVNYLLNTTDSQFCNENNVGCTAYSAAQQSDGSWYAQPAIFLNKNASACDAANGGCTELIRRKNGVPLNLLSNGSFETDADHDAFPDHWEHDSSNVYLYNDSADAFLGTSSLLITAPSGGSARGDGIYRIAITADTERPTAPTDLRLTSASTDTTPTFTWTKSTDNVGIAEYHVRIDTGSVVALGNVITYTVPSALAAGSHTIHVLAVDAAGNRSDVAILSFTISAGTPPPSDTTPPTAPPNLRQTISTSAKFAWDASTDNVKVTGYEVAIDSEKFTRVGLVLTYAAPGIYVGTHTMHVRAVDAAGNVSSASDLSFTLLDTERPTTPTDLARTSSETNTTPTFTWNASGDNVGVTGYEVSIDGGSVASVGTTTYTATSPLSFGSHAIGVRAVDAAGNASFAATLAFTLSNMPPLASRLARTLQNIPLLPQTTYTISLYAKRTSGVSYPDQNLPFMRVSIGGLSTDSNLSTEPTNCDAVSNTQVIKRIAPTESYQRFSCSFTLPNAPAEHLQLDAVSIEVPEATLRSGSVSLLDKVIAPARAISTSEEGLIIDGVQLEQGSTPTPYIEAGAYGAVENTYLKVAPDYLNCTGESGEREECRKYARACRVDEVGCESYTPKNGGPAVPGIIGTGDECPAACVGYDTYRQEASFFEPRAQFPLYFIPATAKQCTAAASGCDEFTNLDAATTGGETRAYFTRLRACQKPGVDSTVYYTWEGSDTIGYQLKVWNLKKSNQNNGPCTRLDPTNSIACQDVADTDTAPSDPKEIPVTYTDTASGIVYATGGCLAADLGVNPDCREFYDASGAIYRRLYTHTITSTADCHPYRKTVSGEDDCGATNGAWNSETGACVYNVYAPESNRCEAQNNGCRTFTGNAGRNTFALVNTNFDSGTSEGWSGGSPSSESVTVNGTSLFSSVAILQYPFAASNTLRVGGIYTLEFWAKGTGSPTIQFTGVSGTLPPYFAGGEGFPVVNLTSEWKQYTLGPLPFDGTPGPGSALQFSGFTRIYLDNIVLREVDDNLYLIKNSWNTPAICDQTLDGAPLPQAMLGCKAYADRTGNTDYLKSFNRLCRQESVGCEAFINTENSAAINAETYNAHCLLTSVCHDSGGCACVVSGTTYCTATNGQSLCDYKANNNGASLAVCGASVDRLCRGRDTVSIPADSGVNLVNDPAFACTSDVKGCEALGENKPNNVCTLVTSCGTASGCVCRKDGQQKCSVNQGERSCVYDDRQTAIDFLYFQGGALQTKYLLNQPDNYGDTLCARRAEGCEAFTFQGTGQAYYFKNPNEALCEYRENVVITPGAPPTRGWFKKGTTDPCGYQNVPGTLVRQPYQMSGSSFGIWKNADTSGAEYQGYVGECSEQNSLCTEYRDGADTSAANPQGKPYYYIKNDKINPGDCNGQVNPKEGCILIRDNSNPVVAYSTAVTYDLAHRSGDHKVNPVDCSNDNPLCSQRCVNVDSAGNITRLFNFCSNDTNCNGGSVCRQVPSTQRPSNDANAIIKATSDRACTSWLACKTSTSVIDPSTNSPRELCIEYGRCLEYSQTGNGAVCTRFDPNPGATVLTPEVYSERSVAFGSADYSGYSIPGVFPVAGMHINTLSAPSTLSISPTSAAPSSCRGFPEPDAPFPSGLVSFDRAGNIVSRPDQNWQTANVCEPGEPGDCQCSYIKTSYGGQLPVRYYNINKSVAAGLCDGGPKNGQSCIPEISYAQNPDVSCGPPEAGGTCKKIEKQTRSIGLQGFCLEQDQSILVNGSSSEYNCLSWYPTSFLSGGQDPYNYVESAGFSAPYGVGGRFYCEEAQGNFVPVNSIFVGATLFNSQPYFGTQAYLNTHPAYQAIGFKFCASGFFSGGALSDSNRTLTPCSTDADCPGHLAGDCRYAGVCQDGAYDGVEPSNNVCLQDYDCPTQLPLPRSSYPDGGSLVVGCVVANGLCVNTATQTLHNPVTPCYTVEDGVTQTIAAGSCPGSGDLCYPIKGNYTSPEICSEIIDVGAPGTNVYAQTARLGDGSLASDPGPARYDVDAFHLNYQYNHNVSPYGSAEPQHFTPQDSRNTPWVSYGTISTCDIRDFDVRTSTNRDFIHVRGGTCAEASGCDLYGYPSNINCNEASGCICGYGNVTCVVALGSHSCSLNDRQFIYGGIPWSCLDNMCGRVQGPTGDIASTDFNPHLLGAATFRHLITGAHNFLQDLFGFTRAYFSWVTAGSVHYAQTDCSATNTSPACWNHIIHDGRALPDQGVQLSPIRSNGKMVREDLIARAQSSNDVSVNNVWGANQVVGGAGGQFDANLQFAYWTPNHGPITSIVIDWGDGSTFETNNSKYKNHIPGCDSALAGGGGFVTSNDACDPNPASYRHTYLYDATHCIATGAAYPALGISASSPRCTFKPKVILKDNWGFCNGTCSGGDDGSDACFSTPEFMIGTLACLNASGSTTSCVGTQQCQLTQSGAGTTFSGTIIIAP